MSSRLLPQPIDNTYTGHRLALWILALVVFVKIAQSVGVIVNGRSVVTSADGIPLDTYTPASAQTIVAVWALSGLFRLIIALLCVLVLVRYRAAVPLMFGLLVLEFSGRLLILHFIPIARTGRPLGPVVNLILFALTIVGLALSLRSRGNHAAQTDLPVVRRVN
jgi:hypothetical protein